MQSDAANSTIEIDRCVIFGECGPVTNQGINLRRLNRIDLKKGFGGNSQADISDPFN